MKNWKLNEEMWRYPGFYTNIPTLLSTLIEGAGLSYSNWLNYGECQLRISTNWSENVHWNEIHLNWLGYIPKIIQLVTFFAKNR